MRARILIPLVAAATLAAPASASAFFAHTVTKGESLSSIAAADGLSVAQLAAANGLPLNAFLVAGSSVQIPPQSSSLSGLSSGGSSAASTSSVPVSTTTSTSSSGSYVVDPVGEPDSRIAAPSGRIPLTSSPLAAASAVALVPIRAAIPLSVSPRTTT